MSTIVELVRGGRLVPYQPTLNARRAFPQRQIHVLPAFIEWARDELSGLEPLEPSDLRPLAQVQQVLKNFIIGWPMRIGLNFHVMAPLESDVYELKTPDIRLFGWFYRRDHFIVVCGADIERLKGQGLYGQYRDRVVEARRQLPLDEPKCLWGAKEHDVVSD